MFSFACQLAIASPPASRRSTQTLLSLFTPFFPLLYILCFPFHALFTLFRTSSEVSDADNNEGTRQIHTHTPQLQAYTHQTHSQDLDEEKKRQTHTTQTK